MARTPRQPTTYNVELSGTFRDSPVAIGDKALAIKNVGTEINNYYSADAMPAPTRRAGPRHWLPADPVELLGRMGERRRATETLGRAAALAFHGDAGVGKTALLGSIALDPPVVWPDGVLYRHVGGQPVEDVLQWMYSEFWETKDIIYVPGPARVGTFLRDIRAFVALDDLDVGTEQAELLVGSAPQCAFALAGRQPALPGRSYPLGGLEPGAARDLFERVAPQAAGDPAVERFVAAVEGLPGYVVLGAELVRDRRATPAALVDEPRAVLTRRRLTALTDEQRRLLGLLAELDPAPLPAELLDADQQHQLENLRDQGLAERHSPRYTLTGPYDAGALEELPRPDPEEVLARCAGAAARDRLQPDDLPGVVAALQWGLAEGDHRAVLNAAETAWGAVVRAGRTGAWGAVTEAGLRSATALDAEPLRAHFLHERGTRLGCMGDLDGAYVALHEALASPARRGDPDAAAVTEHNLAQLFGGPGPPPRRNGNGEDPGGGGWHLPLPVIAAIVAVVLLVPAAVLALNDHNNSKPATADTPQTTTTTTDPAAADRTPPTVTIATPRDGATFTAGTEVRADYRCADADTCEGPVADGEPIDTTAGDHRFTVRSEDAAGNRTTAVASYHVEPTTTTTPQPEPEILIASPKDGATFPAGTDIVADYKCAHASTCQGDVAPGQPVDAQPGPHTFTVTARGDGGTATKAVSYTVEQPQPEPLAIVVDPTSTKSTDSFPVSFSCTGGTAPVSCEGRLDREPVQSPATIGCGKHTLTVRAADAAGATKDAIDTYFVEGPACG